MVGVEVNEQILKYESDIRKIAYWYFRLWPKERYYSVDELIQAGKVAVWRVFDKRPEKIDIPAYVRAAIRYSMINEIKKSVPKLKEIHLVRQYENEESVPLVDLLPVYDGHADEVADLEDMCHYVSKNFSMRDADALKGLAEKSDITFDLNLSKPPSTELKRNVGLVTGMDLSDEEMTIYANVLIGATEKFPRDYVVDGKERAKKYITFLLNQLHVSAEDFALSHNRKKLLQEYHLDSFYQRVYNARMPDLFAHIFPDLEPHQVRGRERWEGPQGLINGYNAIDWVRRKTGKQPKNLKYNDFMRFQVRGFFVNWIRDDWRIAVEFRYPGTYPELSKKATGLWQCILKVRARK